MSTLSFVVYSGDGGTGPFAVPFPYLDRTHVAVKVDGVAATFTWLTDASIALDVAAPGGSAVEVRRSTPRSPLVDFTDGSILTEADLDASALQQIYIAQEVVDLVENSVTLGDDGHFTAAGRRIAFLAAPNVAQDAANKAYVDAITGADHTAAAETAQAAAEAAQAAAEAAAAAIPALPFSTSALADASVTAAKIADGAVTTAKLAAGANGAGLRTVSTDAPSGGADGDVWYQVPV